MKRITNFFHGVVTEMKRVTWPTGKQWRKDVITVLEMAIIFILFFALSDFVLTHLLNLILK